MIIRLFIEYELKKIIINNDLKMFNFLNENELLRKLKLKIDKLVFWWKIYKSIKY